MNKHYRKRNPYPTDLLIDGSTDSQLMDHMGVPPRVAGLALRKGIVYPGPVQRWIDDANHTFRPLDYERDPVSGKLAGQGLILYGPPKIGKTTMAARLLLDLVRLQVENTDPTGKNWSWHGWAMGRFVDWQDASELFRRAVADPDADADALLLRLAMQPNGNALNRGDWLVIDDISRERNTEFNSGELHRILRRRYENMFPTVITTNLSPSKWEENYGEVLASFLGRAFIAVEIPPWSEK